MPRLKLAYLITCALLSVGCGDEAAAIAPTDAAVVIVDAEAQVIAERLTERAEVFVMNGKGHRDPKNL